MISNNNIKKIVEDCRMAGHSVKVRDIAFVLLNNYFEDPTVSFKLIYGGDFTDKEVKKTVASNSISFLKTYIDSNYKENVSESVKTTEKKKTKVEGDITFEENKAQMIKLIEQAEKDYADGLIEAKDRLKIVSELRVKLNDKFNVQDDVKDSVVVVSQKYDEICPYCRREIARKPISKEEAIKLYNLKDNN